MEKRSLLDYIKENSTVVDMDVTAPVTLEEMLKTAMQFSEKQRTKRLAFYEEMHNTLKYLDAHIANKKP